MSHMALIEPKWGEMEGGATVNEQAVVEEAERILREPAGIVGHCVACGAYTLTWLRPGLTRCCRVCRDDFDAAAMRWSELARGTHCDDF